MFIIKRASEKEAVTFSTEVADLSRVMKIIQNLLAGGYKPKLSQEGKAIFKVNPSQGLTYSIWSLRPEEAKELLNFVSSTSNAA